MRTRVIGQENNLVETTWEFTKEWYIAKCNNDVLNDDLKDLPEVVHAYNLLYCEGTDELPSDLSAFLASDSVHKAWFAVTHGDWIFERWGMPGGGRIAPSGFHASFTGKGYTEFLDMSRIMARLLGASPSTQGRVVQEASDTFRLTDSQEILCLTHINAFLSLAGDPSLGLTSKQALDAEFISISTQIEQVAQFHNASTWRWSMSLVLVERYVDSASASSATSHRTTLNDQLAIWQHVSPDSKHKGHIVVHLTNPSHCDLRIRLVAPWFLTITQVTTPGGAMNHTSLFEVDTRKRISKTFEFSTKALAPHIVIDYQAKFVPDSLWPYDQFRGFELPPAFVTCNQDNATSVFSEPALIMIPEPDRSMPFNVITLWSTIIAYTFGTVMTKLVRRLSPRMPQDNTESDKEKLH